MPYLYDIVYTGIRVWEVRSPWYDATPGALSSRRKEFWGQLLRVSWVLTLLYVAQKVYLGWQLENRFRG